MLSCLPLRADHVERFRVLLLPLLTGRDLLDEFSGWHTELEHEAQGGCRGSSCTARAVPVVDGDGAAERSARDDGGGALSAAGTISGEMSIDPDACLTLGH
jgi:hypothetical protein